MTDLSMAYGELNMPPNPMMQSLDSLYAPLASQAQQPQPPSYQQMATQAQQPLPPVPTAPPPQPMPQVQPPLQAPEAMYMQPTPARPVQVYEDGFLARVSERRYEVMKVVMFALIILFAISMDRLFTHYLGQYVAEAILTKGQELLIRAAYPVAVLLVIWFMKAM
jgi:hypothetical protein